MRKKTLLAYSLSAETVERPSPDAPPTAFRIWTSGANHFDGGIAYFTANSARMLMDEQAQRNRPYVFDYNHLSLVSENPESGKAAGWHRLEVRDGAGGPELWAVDCEWTPTMAAGMSGAVPEWRFYSPAFQVDSETGEILGYTNCAVTNNPLTHDLPMLASTLLKKDDVVEAIKDGDPTTIGLITSEIPLLAPNGTEVTTLDPKTALAILLDPNASPEDKQAAAAVLAALLEGPAEPAPEPVEASEPAPPQEDKSAALAASYLILSRKIEALEVREMLHGKVLPPEVKDWALTQSPAVVKSFLASATNFRPAPTAERAASPTVGATGGFVAPPVGSSPVDKVLGLRAPVTGKAGLSREVDQISLSRKITPLTPSQVRAARKAGQ